MIAKDYFASLSKLEMSIEAKKRRIEILRSISSCSSAQLSVTPKGKGKSLCRMADAVDALVDLEKKIAVDEKILNEKKLFLLELTGKIENSDYQTVIIERYLKKKSWDEITVEMFYSSRWVYMLHNRALCELDKLLEQYENNAVDCS